MSATVLIGHGFLPYDGPLRSPLEARMRVRWLALALVVSCGTKSVNLTETVGTTGGDVTAADGSGVSIPPGALPANTNITVNSAGSAPKPSGTSTVGIPYTFGP